jgi:hypothetical protein
MAKLYCLLKMVYNSIDQEFSIFVTRRTSIDDLCRWEIPFSCFPSPPIKATQTQ